MLASTTCALRRWPPVQPDRLLAIRTAQTASRSKTGKTRRCLEFKRKRSIYIGHWHYLEGWHGNLSYNTVKKHPPTLQCDAPGDVDHCPLFKSIFSLLSCRTKNMDSMPSLIPAPVAATISRRSSSKLEAAYLQNATTSSEERPSA